MSRYWLLAIGGGLASIVIYTLSAVLPGGIILAYFAVMPLYLVGFSMGLTAAAAAGATATIGVLIPGGFSAALIFLFVTALPAVILVRQALLSRKDDQGNLVWYPAGLLVMTLCIIAVVLFSAVSLWLALRPEGLEGNVRQLAEAMAHMLFGEKAGDIRNLFVERITNVLPSVAVASWLIMNVVNAALAQGLLVRFQRNIRPSPDIVSMELPYWFQLAAATAVATAVGLLMSGSIGLYGTNLAIILAIPFFFMGLAVVHALCRNKPGGNIMLVLFYVLLIVFDQLAIIIAALGLIEQWVGLRRRFT